MNNNITKGHLEMLNNDYEESCNMFLHALMAIWNLDPKRGFWVGDVVGDVYCYNDDGFIGMDDIRFVVNNNISQEYFEEWMEYNTWARTMGFYAPDLKRWAGGCVRIDEQTRDKLSQMKYELDTLIDETREKFG